MNTSEFSRNLLHFGGQLPNLGMEFTARAFRRSEVCWLNVPWFQAQGVNPLDADVRRELESCLIAEFSYGVPRPADHAEPIEFYENQHRAFLADRYGAPGGTPNHGGSGRCGISGAFNVKGIGATPLVGRNADWYHSHGCMWLEEAIREAALSVVACAEFPFGGVPVVAVIRLGDELQRADGSIEPARALIIRPNFLRLAHFERSIYFGTSGRQDSDQHLDALRVQEAIALFSRGSLNGWRHVTSPGITESLLRISRQIGFGWANRLFHGGYFSSNVTVKGELVDFGSFRAMPDWKRAHTVKSAPPFGSEVDGLSPLVDSLSFYFSKYADRDLGIQQPGELKINLQKAAREEFRSACVEGLGISFDLKMADSTVVDLLEEYFHYQQRIAVDYFKGENQHQQDWIYLNGSRDRGTRDSSTDRQKLELALREYIDRRDGRKVYSRARVWLKPRRLLFRENLIRAIGMEIRKIHFGSGRFEKFIDQIVCRARRHWPSLPHNLRVQAHTMVDGASVLFCRRIDSGGHALIVEVLASDQVLYVLGQEVPLRVADRLRIHGDERFAYVELQESEYRRDWSRAQRIEVGGASVFVPAAMMAYEAEHEHAA